MEEEVRDSAPANTVGKGPTWCVRPFQATDLRVGCREPTVHFRDSKSVPLAEKHSEDPERRMAQKRQRPRPDAWRWWRRTAWLGRDRTHKCHLEKRPL